MANAWFENTLAIRMRCDIHKIKVNVLDALDCEECKKCLKDYKTNYHGLDQLVEPRDQWLKNRERYDAYDD